MKEYTVIITPDAENDLNELDDYITFELNVPEVAAAYVSFIKKQLVSLGNMPMRNKVVDDEPWHSREVHRMNVKNFAIFYVILEDYSEVYILNIIYQKRDIPKLLNDIYGDD